MIVWKHELTPLSGCLLLADNFLKTKPMLMKKYDSNYFPKAEEGFEEMAIYLKQR